jgi:hypothetical protein
MPDAATDAVREELADGLEQIELDAVGILASRGSIDTGDLVRSVESKLSRDGLTGIVGPGAGAAEIVRKKAGSAFGAGSVSIRASTREALWNYFKGYWMEFGTKGSDDVPPQPARPFMTPAFDSNKGRMVRRIRTSVDKALKRVARGG